MDKAAAADAFTPAALAVLNAFAIDVGEVSLAAVSENVTFRVTDRTDGGAYVLRLHRPGYHTLQELQSERVWTRALAEAGIAVPIAVVARDGRDYIPICVAATGETRQAGVTRWTEGALLSAVIDRTEEPAAIAGYFEQLGAITASMHNQSSPWSPPAGFARHRLDEDGLLGDAPFWGPFWEHPAFTAAERGLVLKTRQTIRGVLGRHGRDPSRFCMIHADLHSGNVLVGDGGLTVIDFDDAAFGWRLYDIAVALLRYRSLAGFDAIQNAFLAGYQARRALGQDDLALLPMFLLIRAMAQIGWLGQRPEIDASATIGGMTAEVCDLCAAFEPPL